jgi:hypothetical protein
MTNKKTIAWLASLGMAVVACAQAPTELALPQGGSGSGASAGVPAKQYYVEHVHPALDLTCTWCHAATEAGQAAPNNAPQWLSLSAEAAYDKITAYPGILAHPDNSLLILQGEHMGPALVPKQDQIIREWLMLEVAERGLPNPDNPSSGSGSNPSGTAEQGLNDFADCMTQELWDQHEMYLIPHQQTTGWGPCRGCHNTGWAGAFLDDDQTLTFEQNRKRPYLLKIVTAKVENGAFVDLEQSNRFRNKGVEPCTYEDPALCHPKYVLNPQQDENLTAFFNAVHAAWEAGDCEAGGGVGGEGGAGGGEP